MQNVSLLGIPLDLGGENLGVDINPNAFRHSGIIQKLKQAGINVSDLGNSLCKERGLLHIGNPRLKYFDEILRVSKESAKAGIIR